MEDLIDGFALDQQRRNLSPTTIDKRTRCLRLYAREAGLEANREALQTFLDGRGLSPKSRSVWLSHLASFYRWGVSEGHFSEDPTTGIRAPKVPRKLPRPMPAQELAKALESATALQQAWLLLGALGGLRCKEIAGLRREDILESDGLIRVVETKGGTERMTPLHPKVLAALKAHGLPETGPLFRQAKGKQMTAGDVSHRLGSFLRAQGIPHTPHSLRHYFATEVYRASLDIVLTQRLMGHHSITSTQVYAAPDEAKGAAVVGNLLVA